MSTTATELQEVRAWLAKEKFHERCDYVALLSHLERFAELFARTSLEQHRGMIAEFHNCAGRLPYFQDRDIGAVVLESAADAITDSKVRVSLYIEARFRAIWCAQGATAGGEGTSRARHIQELDEKIRNAT